MASCSTAGVSTSLHVQVHHFCRGAREALDALQPRKSLRLALFLSFCDITLCSATAWGK